MSRIVHAFEYLAHPDKYPPAALTVLFGEEWLLRKLALQQLRAKVFGDADIPEETFDGTTVEWRELHDELATVSLFGGGKPRLAVVQDADKFVSANRAPLESFAAQTHSRNILVLQVSTFPGNTRLYKAVQAQHLGIECGPPRAGRGVDSKRSVRWLVDNATARHDATLSPSAAELLFELVGPDFGRLDNETEKLAVYVGSGGKITPDLVRDLVGGWRTKTTWEMIDAALDGNSALALEQLRDLLQAGEEPIGICAQVAWALRQFAAATRAFQRSEHSGRRQALRDALAHAGIKSFLLEKAERQLKQLGRARASQLYQWLLETDLALKGSHAPDHRARWALEQLILRLSQQLAPRGRAPAS